MDTIELLAPAGDLKRLKIALLYGADAVYIGGQQFSLRSRASNFSLEDIREGAAFAREHGKKVHVTVNMLPHEDDLGGLDDYVRAIDCPPSERAGSLPGGPYLHPAFHDQRIRDPFLEGTGDGSCRARQGVHAGGGPCQLCECRAAGRGVHPWRHVHFLFRTLRAVQSYDQPGCKSRRLCAELSLEICAL